LKRVAGRIAEAAVAPNRRAAQAPDGRSHEEEESRMSKPSSGYAELMAITVGYQASRAVMVAAELGIADAIRDDARSVAETATATRTHAPTLYRLLRALASVGVLHEDGEQRFSLTGIGRHLRSDAPGSPRALARFFGRDYQWAAWGHLLHSVRTGENA